MLWIYTIISVIIVSLVSLIGLFVLALKKDLLYKILTYLVSFSAGTLMGDAFLHLIPEGFESAENGLVVSFSILSGILIFFPH